MIMVAAERSEAALCFFNQLPLHRLPVDRTEIA